MSNRVRRPSRGAFSVIELLVVISIVGVLVSLAGPAIQDAREAARRMTCQDRIRQQALGIHSFHLVHHIIPPNGGPANDCKLDVVGGPPVQPFTIDLNDGRTFLWGVGDRSRPAKLQTGSWCFAILGFVEAQNEYAAGDVDAPLALFQCPTRPRGPTMAPIDDANGQYESGGLAMTKTDFCGNGRLIPNRPHWKSFRDIRDGLSQTILVGEKSYDPTVQNDTSWYWDEPIWIGGSKGTARSGLQILPDRRGIPFKENWGSPHQGGALFAFADGHVQFLTQSTDWQLMAAMLSPDGGETETVAK